VPLKKCRVFLLRDVVGFSIFEGDIFPEYYFFLQFLLFFPAVIAGKNVGNLFKNV